MSKTSKTKPSKKDGSPRCAVSDLLGSVDRGLKSRDEAYTGDIERTNEEESAWHNREDSGPSSRSGLAFTHARNPDA
jgi:hypothetical protein